MISRTVAPALALALAAALSACGSSSPTSSSAGTGLSTTNSTPSTPAASATSSAPADPTAALIQQRYGSCLRKLHATPDATGPALYSFDVSGGRLLVIKVREFNGKTYTMPNEAKDVDLLSSVGC